MVNQHSGIYQETNGTGALMSHRCLPPTLSKMNAITVQNKCRHRTALFDHKHVVVSRVPWAGPGGRFTRDFESGCAWLMTVAGQKTVSGFPHIAWRTAGDIAGRVAGRPESSMPCMFDGLHAIGVDETGRRKGHAYITVIVDHGRGRVIWAHDGHGRQVPGLFFRQLTPERRASIRIVTGDGAGWIDASVAEHRPNAERVLGSFHIVSWMTDALDRVGKRLWNQAGRDGSTTATEAMRGVEYAVPGNPGDLTERRSTALATLADADPKGRLYRSWRLRNSCARSRASPSNGPKRNPNDGSAGRPAAASPRSSNHAGRSAHAATTSSQPSGSAVPTPGSKRSTTRSRSPSAWPTASATRTTPSP